MITWPNLFKQMELCIAISMGKSNRALGPSGIGLEFFKVAWEVEKLDLLHILKLCS